MVFVTVFLVALVGAIVGATAFLVLRERARRHQSDNAEGMLIEQHRTAHATRMRATYSSVSVHHGNGVIGDEGNHHRS
ncbi:hypothetical protein DR950_18530 [Kitasatospora xanthocidica]|uniref:Uncharacterized protein n=1 Tax=Kitasatospora xanthocidica TaxID=83382 RepID=A0A372ZVR4_9ACTN|nr:MULTISPECIES: hypothetical protein [Streptomycetaceae]OKI11059.1 hypothetical protein AMK13_00860 [Streptomyces sp. CB02056]RGD59522.1 hypothetical protein DR950_18530 [Kitasatospora xanthocidica]